MKDKFCEWWIITGEKKRDCKKKCLTLA